MARDYPFELPLNIPSWYVPTIADRLLSANLWSKVPTELADKINFAMTNNTGVMVAQEDLDPVSDEDWVKVLKAIKSG